MQVTLPVKLCNPQPAKETPSDQERPPWEGADGYGVEPGPVLVPGTWTPRQATSSLSLQDLESHKGLLCPGRRTEGDDLPPGEGPRGEGRGQGGVVARSPQVFDAGSPGATVYSLWDPGHIINLFGSSVFTSVKWVPYSLPQQRFLWGLNEVASHCFTIIVRRSGRLIQPFTYLTTPGGSSLGVLSLLEGLRGGQIPKGGPGTMDWAPEAWREAVTSLLPPSGIKWECCTREALQEPEESLMMLPGQVSLGVP